MNVCFATSECIPYAKVGGLGDVSGALPVALEGLGVNVKVFLPLYQSINTLDHDLTFAEDLYETKVHMGDHAVVFNTWHGHLPGSPVDVYFIDCPQYYHRPFIYTNDEDEDRRFILLQRAAFEIMQRYAWSPNVIHCNDWQTALMPAMLRQAYGWDSLFSRTASLLTVHNIGFQGRFHESAIYTAGLQYEHFYPGGPMEYHGSFNALKTGICFADAISTVSETYAREIQTSAFGEGMEGALAARSADLFGIVNGIDVDTWNPATDPLIAQNYDKDTLDLKVENKKALLNECHLPFAADVPVIGIVSRLSAQKGFELLHPILEPLLEVQSFQLVALGIGQAWDEDFFRWAASKFPDRVHARIGYDEALAHRIEAGADIFLMPSRYEPCGLNQMFSLRYGTVPVVRKTGGLADTVHDYHEYHGKGNGFSFYDYSPHALYTSIERALSLFGEPKEWRQIQRRGMSADFSWTHSAEAYLDLYTTLMKRKAAV